MLACALIGSEHLLNAQIVASSTPVGYRKMTLLGNSDSIVSVSFSRPVTQSGLVASATGSSIQIQGSPGWAAGQFVYASGVQSNHYFVRFTSGSHDGRSYDITNNGADSLELDLAGGSLTGVAANDSIEIIPHWTFGTVFPEGRGVHVSTSTFVRQTEVLVPNTAGTGVNPSAGATYYYYSNATASVAWRKVNSPATNLNDDVIRSETYLTIRHKISSPTTYWSLGEVVLNKVALPIKTSQITKQDNPVAIIRPVSFSLNESGLIESGAFEPSLNAFSRKDELYLYDNTTTNFNKSASATYYYYNSQWRKVNGGTADYGPSNIFLPGAGFTIRKATNAATLVWTNSPTY